MAKMRNKVPAGIFNVEVAIVTWVVKVSSKIVNQILDPNYFHDQIK